MAEDDGRRLRSGWRDFVARRAVGADRLAPWWRRWRAVILGIAGAALCIQLFSPLTLSAGAFRIRFDLTLFDGGWTVVYLPPLGRIEAHTHAGPVGVGLTLVDVNLPSLGRLAARASSASRALHDLEGRLGRDAATFAGWVLLMALLGGVLLPLLVGERDWRRLRAAASAGLATAGAAMLLTWGTYRPQAFQEPHYVGALTAAPGLIAVVDETFRTAGRFEQQLGFVASNLFKMFHAIDTLQPLPARRTGPVILFISDVHNNPAAFVLVRRLALAFRPDFIIDAGDLTDFGTAVESRPLPGEIESLHLPYLFVAGNHEKAPELAVLRHTPGVVMLDGQEVVEDGVPIVGIPDPASTTTSSLNDSPAELAQAAGRLQADVAAAPQPPTIVVAHNPDVVAPLAGRVPIVLNGHTHTIWVRSYPGGVWLNDGTTGAAGLRGLSAPQPTTPYSLMILFLDATAGGRQYCRAVDTVRVTAVTGTVDLTQQVFAPPAATG